MYSLDILSTQRASSTDGYMVELSSFPKETSSSLGGRQVENMQHMAVPWCLGGRPAPCGAARVGFTGELPNKG